jgi:uncharacterized protein YbjT (DUF2867 family)
MSKGIRVILTGATGMVGEGVLHECLKNHDIEQVLVVGRKLSGMDHPKLTEIVHPDFFDLSPIENKLTNYDACLFCLGTSSINKKEKEFYRLTYTLTLHFATTLSKLNSGMTFCYISGAGTDSSENGRAMWARVKGKTENDLMKLPFKQVYNFRPGYIQPTKGLKNAHGFYQFVDWMYPVFKSTLSKYVCTLTELGLAMIHAATKGYKKQIIEVKDIVELSKS